MERKTTKDIVIVSKEDTAQIYHKECFEQLEHNFDPKEHRETDVSEMESIETACAGCQEQIIKRFPKMVVFGEGSDEKEIRKRYTQLGRLYEELKKSWGRLNKKVRQSEIDKYIEHEKALTDLIGKRGQ